MMAAQLKSKHLPKIGKPPWGEVTDWYSWDSMPTVVIRDPADGGLAAWSSSSPGKRWPERSILDATGGNWHFGPRLRCDEHRLRNALRKTLHSLDRRQ
jgi:hypothetical protein